MLAVVGTAGCALLLRLGRAGAVGVNGGGLGAAAAAAMWLALLLAGRVEADEALALLVVPGAPLLARLLGLAFSGRRTT